MEVRNSKIGSLVLNGLIKAVNTAGYLRITSWPAEALGSGLLLYQDWVAL